MRASHFGRWALLLAFSLWTSTAHAGGPRVHVVYSGQTLGMIAKRYNVSIDAICTANDISRRDPIKPKQRLVIPDRSDKTGEKAKAAAKPSHDDSKKAPDASRKRADKAGSGDSKNTKRKSATVDDSSWKKYRRPARRPGYVTLRGTSGRWQGYAIVKGGKISGRGRQGFRKVLASWRTGETADIDARLIHLVSRVSDEFGGRPIRVVSGFRRKSHSRESRHKHGRAIDFAVEGVPNAALRDYLRTLDNVGVGYYPNSSFVHLDVRSRDAFWVDDAGPGESPRYRKHASKADDGAEPDDDVPTADDKDAQRDVPTENQKRAQRDEPNQKRARRDMPTENQKRAQRDKPAENQKRTE